MNMKSKFLGSMLGSALGDAIGEMAFRARDREALEKAIDRTDLLVYTDDTAMVIGLAQSIVRTGGVEEKDLGDTFRANYEREPWRGYASGPPTIFSLVKAKGVSYSEAARRLFGKEGSFGNGAAMRVSPVGLFYCDTPDLYDHARASAVVTHTHPVGADGAAVLARAVAEAAKRDAREPLPVDPVVQDLADFSRTPEIREKILRVGALLREKVPPGEAAAILGQTVAVHESMPFAVYAFLLHPNDFTACLFCAVLHGGDRDTLGAMACAISGAHLGVEALPRQWLDRLENRSDLERLATELHSRRLG